MDLSANTLAGISLVTFTVQNAAFVLLMRLTKVMNTGYNSGLAVLMMELLKLPLTLALLVFEQGAAGAYTQLRTHIYDAPWDTLKIAVPALLYTVQNNALFVAVGNLEAVVFQVTYQLKTFFTAVATVLIIGRRVAPHQWVALLLLTGGTLLVQEPSKPAAKSAASPVNTATAAKHPHHERHHQHAHAKAASARALAEDLAPGRLYLDYSSPPDASGALFFGGEGTVVTEGRALAEEGGGSFVLGFSATILACVCSALASVYLEKILITSKPSIWVRNTQLCLFTIPIALIGKVLMDKPSPAADDDGGFFHGFTFIVWLAITINAAGGMLVAVVMKFAGNILRSFAQACAIILGGFGSAIWFDFQITSRFILGLLLVFGSIFLYGAKEDQLVDCRTKLTKLLPAAYSAVSLDSGRDSDRVSGRESA